MSTCTVSVVVFGALGFSLMIFFKSLAVLERIYSDLGLSKEKHTTDDMLFTVETVSCLGACGLAPVVMVNDDVHPSMNPDAVTELLKSLKEEA